MIETSARAFVELRKGHSQFGNEMAVRTVNATSPLTQANESSQVLAYLLDIQADATSRIQELTSAYADIMIHQVALLSGMMEGVRGLLLRLGPETIDKEIDQSRARLGPLRFLWPFRAGARWKRFVERHQEYSQEERQLSAAVFGSEFARGYSAVVGEELHDKSVKLVRGKG
jgi:type VI secretion system protein